MFGLSETQRKTDPKSEVTQCCCVASPTNQIAASARYYSPSLAAARYAMRAGLPWTQSVQVQGSPARSHFLML